MQQQMNRLIPLLLFLSFIVGGIHAHAQGSQLKKKMSVQAKDIPVKDVLKIMEKKGGFLFSYNAQIANTDRKVSVDYRQESVEKILDHLFQKQLEYKSVGKHIIFFKKDISKEELKKNKKITYTISGFIVDHKSGALIKSATVHDVQGSFSALTNEKGRFQIELPADNPYRSISFSRNGYQDTIIIIHPKEGDELQISLVPVKPPVDILEAKNDSSGFPPIDRIKMVDFLVSDEVQMHALNMEGLQQVRFGQVSFLPYAGTHLKSSGSYTNRFSLNILAGYSGGVQGVEIGGLVNMNRGKVQGAQLGGLANITGGHVYGVQLGGLLNTCKNGVQGAQIGGIFNHNTGSVYGLQLGGVFNDSREHIRGAQIAGITNYHQGSVEGLQLSGIFGFVKDTVRGAQISGIANYCNEEVQGAQIAGIVNTTADHVKGFQIGGISSLAGSVDGGQISGISNIVAHRMSGTQLAGIANVVREDINGIQFAGILNVNRGQNKGIQLASILNYSDMQNGFQIGLVNLSDSSNGVSLGLINYSRRGFQQWELAVNEVHYARLSWKSGSHKLYNIYGMEWGQKEDIIWGPRLGFGSYKTFRKKTGLAAELTTAHVNHGNEWAKAINLLNRFELSFSWNINSNISLFAGPSVNLHLSTLKDINTNEYLSDLGFYPFYNHEGVNTKLTLWAGLSAGLRL